MKVQVVYALPEVQQVRTLDVEQGCEAKTAIEQSKILQEFPDIDLTQQAIGVFGHTVSLDYELQPNDRIEIYRPLKIDPRDARIAKVKAERRRNN